jgi:hypothetical protein
LIGVSEVSKIDPVFKTDRSEDPIFDTAASMIAFLSVAESSTISGEPSVERLMGEPKADAARRAKTKAIKTIVV